MKPTSLPSSFRDPSGFVFYHKDRILRQINPCYQKNYEFLIRSGLYRKLVNEGLLIPHHQIKAPKGVYKIIEPKKITFISYPYEWCFTQLKEAALLTLKIQKLALKWGMSLKDCSVYNVQFIGSKPIFIDTLSFERYVKGAPWVAYRQFCQHFLAPLALMGHVDIRLNQLLKSHIDGLPLDMAVSLLPSRDRFNFGFLMHIYAHSKAQKYCSSVSQKNAPVKLANFSLNSFYGLIDSLESVIQKIKRRRIQTRWADYYSLGESYTSEAIASKRMIIEKWISRIRKLDMACNFGANKGLFSRITSLKEIYTISSDFDPVCVESNYLLALKNKEINILPLLLDISNPSPGIGWDNKERKSFVERGPFDLVTALALVHHLAISNNLPLAKISDFFKQVSKVLIIEFVPKDDAMVKRMFFSRKDIFRDYTRECFEKEFVKNFIIEETVAVNDSKRTLYLMRRKD